MSKRGSNSELFARENDALPLGHSSTNNNLLRNQQNINYLLYDINYKVLQSYTADKQFF